MSNNTVVYELVNTEPTTYIRENGLPIDKPARRKILMEYTGYAMIGNEQKLVHFRHIRGQKSFLAEKQDNKAEFNPRKDNAYFINGLLVVPEIETVTISALDAHMNNEANASLYPDKLPVFRKVNPEKDAKVSLDMDKLRVQAQHLVYSLYEDDPKSEDSIKVKSKSDLSIMAHIFNTSYDLGEAVQINELMSMAKSNPAEFIYKFNQGKLKLIESVDSAIEDGVIISKDEKFVLSVDGTEICKSKGVNADNQTKVIIQSLVSTPAGRGVIAKIEEILSKNKLK